MVKAIEELKANGKGNVELMCDQNAWYTWVPNTQPVVAYD
jgi:hypothetical protein